MPHAAIERTLGSELLIATTSTSTDDPLPIEPSAQIAVDLSFRLPSCDAAFDSAWITAGLRFAPASAHADISRTDSSASLFERRHQCIGGHGDLGVLGEAPRCDAPD